MNSFKKVSKLCQDLVARGLLDREEARRISLVASLAPTLAETGHAVSEDMLAEVAGLSVNDLAEHIEYLRSLGFKIVSDAPGLYRLVRRFDDLLVPEAVLFLLLDQAGSIDSLGVGLPYRYQAQCGSTNASLKSEAAHSPNGTLVVTDDQTQGRGRLGRSWMSSPGLDLTFSVLLRPSILPEDAPMISLATALAITEVLERFGDLGGRVKVKWPNDVLIDDRKVCGILLESSLEGADLLWVVLGVGLNVNSDPYAGLIASGSADTDVWRGRPTPTSLLVETGREVSRGSLLATLVARFATLPDDAQEPDFLARLRAHDALCGRKVEVYAGPPDGTLMATGEAVGLGSKGELLVKDHRRGTVSVYAGEVTLSVDR